MFWDVCKCNPNSFVPAITSNLGSLLSDLMRSGSESDPAIVEGDDKLSLLELHVDLPASEQHQRVDGDHAAVPDEDAARLHLLVVHQVGAVEVANLEHKKVSKRLHLLK